MCTYVCICANTEPTYIYSCTHLLCGVAISSGVKAEKHNVLHKLQVGVEPRCAVPSSQHRWDGDLREGVKESEEGTGEGVFLHL